MPAEPKGGHCQPTTASSEHRLDANNLFTDGEKEALTRKDERRRPGEEKIKDFGELAQKLQIPCKIELA